MLWRHAELVRDRFHRFRIDLSHQRSTVLLGSLLGITRRIWSLFGLHRRLHDGDVLVRPTNPLQGFVFRNAGVAAHELLGLGSRLSRQLGERLVGILPVLLHVRTGLRVVAEAELSSSLCFPYLRRIHSSRSLELPERRLKLLLQLVISHALRNRRRPPFLLPEVLVMPLRPCQWVALQLIRDELRILGHKGCGKLRVGFEVGLRIEIVGRGQRRSEAENAIRHPGRSKFIDGSTLEDIAIGVSQVNPAITRTNNRETSPADIECRHSSTAWRTKLILRFRNQLARTIDCSLIAQQSLRRIRGYCRVLKRLRRLTL